MTGSGGAHEYCAIRVVPDIERGEFLNAGVILISRAHRFLGARIELDREKLQSINSELTADAIELIESHLALIPKICAGDVDGGPVARLGQGERWHWLTAPSSTIVQPGPVHTGINGDPAAQLDRLFTRLVGHGPGSRRKLN